MRHLIEKSMRTIQSAVPSLKTSKDSTYLYGRRIFKLAHEYHFKLVQRYPAIAADFVDIGANQGQSIESVLLYNPLSRVTSFEPNPTIARKLRRRYAGRTNIDIMDLGLGDVAGSFDLYVPSYNGFVYDGAASLDFDAAHWPTPELIFGFDERKLTISRHTCRIATLDTFKLAPSFIKIDVQGWEYKVLIGSKQTLREFEPLLLIEAPDPASMTFLDELGYREYGFFDGELRPGRQENRYANALFATAGRMRSLRDS